MINFFKDGEGDKLKVYDPESSTNGWLKGDVPGDIHLDLMKAGKIADPLYGENAKDCRWTEIMEWWYRKSFSIPQNFRNKKVYLVFEGLDCFATIWLNGRKLGTTEDMYISYSFDVTQTLRYSGENTLVTKLASPIKAGLVRDVAHLTPAFNVKERIYVRKSPMHYGWDFAPRIITTGVWKDVKLVSFDKLSIDRIFVSPRIKGSREAELSIEIEVTNHTSTKQRATIEVCVEPINFVAEKIVASWSLEIGSYKEVTVGKLEVHDAKLWWPSGMGDQNLYKLIARIKNEQGILDEDSVVFGIREVKLLVDPTEDCGSRQFIFRINGQKVFCQGANWVPADVFPSRIRKEKYQELLNMTKETNMNMLRIWGGGIIESKIFYDMCDILGIMIWHDLPFSCSDYPETQDFIQLITSETSQIVKRLRNHPSIVLWCGGNELDWLSKFGSEIFHKVLPQICRRLDPTRPYWISSPYGGAWPNSPEEGDEHNWYVWHEKRPYQQYGHDNARFVSEFGLQSSPCLKSLEKFIPVRHLYLDDNIWRQYRGELPLKTPEDPFVDPLVHNNILEYHSATFEKLAIYTREFGEVKNVDTFVKYSQMAQAFGLKYAIEHYRRRKYHCGGCLVWQYNDVWPAIDWSIVDYYLLPKPAYYYVKKAFSPLLVSFSEEENVSLWIVSNLYRSIEGRLIIKHATFEGKALWQRELKIMIPADGTERIMTGICDRIEIRDKTREYLYARICTKNAIYSENFYFFVEPKDLNLPSTAIRLNRTSVDVSRSTRRGKFEIYVDKYARIVTISSSEFDFKVDDNYFDIPAGGRREVSFEIQTFEENKKNGGHLVISAWNSRPVSLPIRITCV